jgi:hypothetical protein
VFTDPDEVAVVVRLDPVDPVPELGDVGLEVAPGRTRGPVPPQGGDQLIAGDSGIGPDQEGCQQLPMLFAVEGNRAPEIINDFERSEQSEIHGFADRP